MGINNRWRAHIVDLDILYAAWHKKNSAEPRMTTRMREVNTICMFALCIENDNGERYAVGFQPQNQHQVNEASVADILEDTFHILEDDCDAILVKVPPDENGLTSHHRCQLTSFVRQKSMTERDWVCFLSKKLRFADDDDLRLVIHCEQEGPCNLQFISAYLKHDSNRCPYSQVFILGQMGSDPPAWQCHMVYPSLAALPVLTKDRAEQLLSDRPRYNRPA